MIIIKIYLDFDGTIYNSTKLYNEFINIFIKHNINKNYLNNIIKECYQKEKNYITLAKKIIKDTNLDTSILNEINNLYSNKLLFKDTIPFLEKYYQQ